MRRSQAAADHSRFQYTSCRGTEDEGHGDRLPGMSNCTLASLHSVSAHHGIVSTECVDSPSQAWFGAVEVRSLVPVARRDQD